MESVITLKLDDEFLIQARKLAKKRGKSVTRLFRELICSELKCSNSLPYSVFAQLSDSTIESLRNEHRLGRAITQKD